MAFWLSPFFISLFYYLYKVKEISRNMPVSTNIYLPLQFNQLIDLLKALPEKEKKKIINVLKQEDEEPSKEKILEGISQAVKEINLVKAGKLKARDARALINEL